MHARSIVGESHQSQRCHWRTGRSDMSHRLHGRGRNAGPSSGVELTTVRLVIDSPLLSSPSTFHQRGVQAVHAACSFRMHGWHCCGKLSHLTGLTLTAPPCSDLPKSSKVTHHSLLPSNVLDPTHSISLSLPAISSTLTSPSHQPSVLTLPPLVRCFLTLNKHPLQHPSWYTLSPTLDNSLT